MIADLFKKLFEFIKKLFVIFITAIWQIAEWIIDAIKKIIDVLIDLLISFFDIIIDLIRSMLYVIYMISVIVAKFFMMIFDLAKLLWSFIVGLTKTIASFSYTPQSSGDNGYSTMIGKIFGYMDVLQLDVIAYILLFIIWYTTAILSIKMISNIRIGGD